MRRAASIVCLALLAWIVDVARVDAQTPPGRVEVGAGPTWLGKSGLGSSNATETTPTGPGSVIFTTATTLGSTAGLGVHIGVRAWRQLEVEAFSTYAKPTLEVAVANDIENAAPVTATETLRQYTVGGGALWYLQSGRGASRLRPFVGGSIAYLRQLHESDTLAVTGRMYDIGGGVKYVFGARPAKSAIKTLGLRGDVRLVAATKAVGFTDRARYSGSVGASLFARF